MTKCSVKKLVKLKDCETLKFEEKVLELCLFKRTLIVPLLVQGCLRIKLIDKEVLELLRKSMEDGGNTDYHEAKSSHMNKNMIYIFGHEPKQLESALAYGRLISVWGLDPLVTELRLSYKFAKFLLCVFGTGYGGRKIADCLGLNLYFKYFGRGTSRPNATPGVAEEDIALHQYRRGTSRRYDLMSPYYRKGVNDLTRSMGRFAKKYNNSLMRLVGSACSRQVVTTGNIPRARKVHRKKRPSPDAANTCTFSPTPTVGFVNENHCDFMDKLSKLVKKRWLQRAKKNNWTHCIELIEAEDGFCLPTTIGYQFCFSGSDDIEVKAFFSMDGLGLAMEIVDGIGHQFMAATFSHHSCLPIFSTHTDHVSCSNDEDQFLLVAYGISGGNREAKEKIARDDAAGDKNPSPKGGRKRKPHVKPTRQRGKRKRKHSSSYLE
jgi:hypothetical protein